VARSKADLLITSITSSYEIRNGNRSSGSDDRPEYYARLKLYARHPTEGYQRQNVVYVPSETDTASSVANQPDPLTYSVTWLISRTRTLHRLPGHIMLVTDTSGTAWPDWTDANVSWYEIPVRQYSRPDEPMAPRMTWSWRKRAFSTRSMRRTNNAMLYTALRPMQLMVRRSLGRVARSLHVGTWSISFRDNTNVTLTASDGSNRGVRYSGGRRRPL